MIARPATPGPWLDVSAPISATRAAAMLRRGFVGAVRYVPLPGNSPALDISEAELRMLTAAGLDVGFVQHPRAHNALSAHSGGGDAMAAATHAKTVLAPPGCHLFLDLEGVVDTSPDQVFRYCSDWADACVQLGYLAGLYVGYDHQLDPARLYQIHNVTCYWSDFGVEHVSTRGFAVKQHPEVKADPELGDYDPDTVAPDALGGLPVICAAE